MNVTVSSCGSAFCIADAGGILNLFRCSPKEIRKVFGTSHCGVISSSAVHLLQETIVLLAVATEGQLRIITVSNDSNVADSSICLPTGNFDRIKSIVWLSSSHKLIISTAMGSLFCTKEFSPQGVSSGSLTIGALSSISPTSQVGNPNKIGPTETACIIDMLQFSEQSNCLVLVDKSELNY